MSEESIKDRIPFVNNELFNRKNLDLSDEVFAADYVAHLTGGAGLAAQPTVR